MLLVTKEDYEKIIQIIAHKDEIYGLGSNGNLYFIGDDDNWIDFQMIFQKDWKANQELNDKI